MTTRTETRNPAEAAANRRAVESMIGLRPVLQTLATARDVIPGMAEDLLLHAGPPIEWRRMSGPLRGAVIGALLYEGRARGEAEAVELVESGEVRFAPCHHHRSAAPMAGLISPSMAVYVVEDEHGARTFSNLNEGLGKVLRYGAKSAEVLDHLRWINETLAPSMARALERIGGLDMKALLAKSLHMGDDGHNRNDAGSLLVFKALAPAMAAMSGTDLEKILRFSGDTALTVLNPLMATGKAMADAAHGVEGSTLVTAMARNGTEIGIRVSGLGDRWFTAPAPIPSGIYFEGFRAEDANPDLGDSTITETVGIGAFAMAAAPAIAGYVGGKPSDTLAATLEMYEITVAEHPDFTIPQLDFRGTPVGIDIRRVVEKGITPRFNTGIAHKKAGVGQIGAGLVRPPMSAFEEALRFHDVH